MRLLVTRPEPEAGALAERLAGLGVTAMLAPMLAVVSCLPERLPLDGVAAVAVTSRNALKALAAHADLPCLVRLPIFAVGPGTAAQARGLGFAEVVAGPAAASDLPALMVSRLRPGEGTVLVVRGETVAFDLAAALGTLGYATRSAVVYRTHAPAALPQAVRAALAAGGLDGVVLMSPETAKVFTKLVQGADLIGATSRLICFCLSPAVAAAAAPLGAAEVIVAAKPNLEEMLAQIAWKASLFGT